MLATSSSHVAAVTQRVFSTSSCVFSRKTLIPFDDRFELNPKDVGPHRKGGNTKLARYLGRRSKLMTQEYLHINAVLFDLCVWTCRYLEGCITPS